MSMSSHSAAIRSFASDNFAGVHPAVMENLQAANLDHAIAYGGDVFTAEAENQFERIFGAGTKTFFVFGGTGGNVFALSSLCGPGDAVLCSQWSHLHIDETGAPERAGIKLLAVPSVDAKVTTKDIERVAGDIGVMHHAQPRVVSLTQPTELGTLYTAEEIEQLCLCAHEHGLLVHMDGARIANATAALGGISSLRKFTVDAGVDVLTFGGTKNGLMYGEAVLYFPQGAARAHSYKDFSQENAQRALRYAPYARKQTTQLPSKMRFVSAQFAAVLKNDLWVQIGASANDAAASLHAAVQPIQSLELLEAPAVNSLYPTISPRHAELLREVSFFWDWEPARHRVRWMTSWDTEISDVNSFAEAVYQIVT
jgi:threonine aldolase